MFKKFLFAVVPMVLVAGSAFAGDDLLAAIANLDGAVDAAAQVENADKLGQADVDALLGEDDNESGEEAVAACFRRGFGHSYGSYGGYNSYCGYRSYCAPSYSYNYCYPVQQCYTPVTYTYCAPVSYSCYSPCYTSYWGCW
jgi:hypothetical protein